MKIQVLAVGVFLGFASVALAAPVVISETVGQVSGEVLTSREVQISVVLNHILFPSKDSKPGLVEIHLKDPNLNNEVTALLLEHVVALEAENFSVAQVSEADLQQNLRKVEKAVEGKPYWQALEVGQDELKRFVLQKLTTKAFIQFKTNSMAGTISDAEALAYFEKNRIKFGDLPFENFKDNIKTFLSQQQLEERSRAWFEIIKRKYKVRNILSENANNKVESR